MNSLEKKEEVEVVPSSIRSERRNSELIENSVSLLFSHLFFTLHTIKEMKKKRRKKHMLKMILRQFDGDACSLALTLRQPAVANTHSNSRTSIHFLPLSSQC
jgi:hypothetical protein